MTLRLDMTSPLHYNNLGHRHIYSSMLSTVILKSCIGRSYVTASKSDNYILQEKLNRTGQSSRSGSLRPAFPTL